jgi:cullin 1
MDKDIFQSVYTNQLAKRLLLGTSITSNEAEASLIAKLRDACGYEYTVKMQRMFAGAAGFSSIRSHFLIL